MAVITWQKRTMPSLLKELGARFPDLTFTEGQNFHWSPKDKTITFRHGARNDQFDTWALLHEVGHAVLEHQTYNSDLELLLMEVAAWQKATELGTELGVTIDQDHVQDCLDTYRDWLHQRSTCPTCSISSLQVLSDQYRCHNCNTQWHVSASRFCRAYRRRKLTTKQKKSPEVSQTTFM